MKKISNILKELKKLGVTGVKQSTEDEGSSFKDIILMRKITQKIGINLNIKIKRELEILLKKVAEIQHLEICSVNLQTNKKHSEMGMVGKIIIE